MTFENDGTAWPRWLNVVAGIWLFISAFAWPHASSAQTNTWMVGVLVCVFAFVAMWRPAVRWANTALAAWLFLSTWLIPHLNVATVWNNLVLAMIVFVVSLTPSGTMDTTGRHPIGDI
jgi:hypothetical protein